MAHLNIHSLKNKVERLEIFFEKMSPDVICFSEHHLKEQERSTIKFEGFYEGSVYCRKHKTKGGTGIYLKHSIKSAVVNVQDLTVEGEIEICAVHCPELKTNIACVYRPPNGTHRVFFSRFEKLLNRICTKDFTVFIGGDFNINLAVRNDRGEKLHKDRLLKLLQAFSLCATINNPTRETNTTATIIDNIFTNLKDDKYKAFNTDPGLSDHNCQVLSAKIPQNTTYKKIAVKYTFKRSFSEKNINLFKALLQTHDWNSVFLEQGSIDSWYDCFVRKIKGCFEIAFPIKKHVNKINKKCEWITSGIRKSKETYELLAIFNKKTKDTNLKNLFKKYRTIYKKVIKESKKMCNAKKIANAVNRGKEIWKIIKSMENLEENAKPVLSKLDLDKTSINDKVVMANELNKYFSNIGKQCIGNVGEAMQFYLGVNNCSSYFCKPVTEREVSNIIGTLKNKMTCGPDGIPVAIIKKVKDEIAEPLKILMNQSVEIEKCPEKLKDTRLIAIQKDKKSFKLQDLRPLAITSVFSKIFETNFYNGMVNYLNKNELITRSQHGYIKGRSTQTAVLDLTNRVYDNLDKGKEVVVLFLDLSKAFNCVETNTLLEKLSRHGFRGKFLNWVESFLKNRPQYVEMADEHETIRSSTSVISNGVPQGSVLGPLLFSIYMNDLPDFLESKAECVMYADDCSVVVSGNNRGEVRQNLENVILLLQNYFRSNNLLMNLKKTHFLQIKKSHLSSHYWKLSLNHPDTKVVTQTSEHKFLGIVIDDFLNFKLHVDTLVSTLQSASYVFKKLVKYADANTTRTAYFGYVESRLRYGILIWGSSAKQNVERVFKKQKKIIRIIKKADRDASCRQFFCELKILTLPSLIIKLSSIEIKKNLQKFEEKNKQKNYKLRNRNKVPLNNGNKLESFQVDVYNNLPERIKVKPLKEFTKDLDIFLLEKAFYSIDEFKEYIDTS